MKYDKLIIDGFLSHIKSTGYYHSEQQSAKFQKETFTLCLLPMVLHYTTVIEVMKLSEWTGRYLVHKD